MNFCPKCHFMLYTKIISEDTSKLKNYCKNCDWSGDYQSSEENIVVYRKNYSNEFLTEKTLLSENVINDPTLPRINNISCVNLECLTNKNYEEEKCFYLKTKDIDNIAESEINTKINNIIDNEEVNFEILRINESMSLLKFNNKIDSDKFKVFMESNEGIQINSYLIEISAYSKPNREIIFIKYDSINMKYIYLCSTCKSSWKNE